MADIAEAQAAIKRYLLAMNRPYNANNMIDEFSSKFKKSVIAKAMQALEDSKEIQVKIFGKIKIYLTDQKQFSVPSEEEMKLLDAGIVEHEELLRKMQEQVSTMSAQNDELERTPTDSNLQQEMSAVSNALQVLEARLLSCKTSLPCLSKLPAKSVLEESLKASSAMVRKRKRACEAIIEHLSGEDSSKYTRGELLEMFAIDQELEL